MASERDKGGLPTPALDLNEKPGLTDAPAEVGNTSDLAGAERLEEDRALRDAENRPDLPDRAFDRITPQV